MGFVSAEKAITKKILLLIKKIFGKKPAIEKRGNVEIITLSGHVFYDFFT